MPIPYKYCTIELVIVLVVFSRECSVAWSELIHKICNTNIILLDCFVTAFLAMTII